MPSRQLLSQILYWLLIAIVCGSFCYIMAIYPYAQDDLEFKYLSTIFGENGQRRIIRSLILNDNGRLANILVVLMIKIPKWIPTIIQCIALIAGVFMILKVANLKKNLAATTLLLSLFVLAPVWEDSMFTMDYAFNYIVPIPFIFGTIYLFFSPKKHSSALCFFIGFIASLFHESNGFALLGGWFLLWLFNRDAINKRNFWCPLGTFLGLTVLLSCPGPWNRQTTVHFEAQHLLRLVFDWIYFAYLFIWLICLSMKHTRKIALKPLLIFGAGQFIFIPFVYLTGSERSGMPSLLICCVTTTILLKDLWDEYNIKSRVFKPICVGILYAFTTIHLITVDREASIVLPMFENMYNTFRDAPKGPRAVFVPIRYSWDAPIIALRRPHWILLDPNDWSLRFAKEFAGRRHELMAVPIELKEYQGCMGEAVPSEDSVYIWNGHIISHNLEDTTIIFTHTTYKHSLKPENAPVAKVAFPGKDGRQYVYIVPKRSAFSTYLGAPVDIKLIRRDDKQLNKESN